MFKSEASPMQKLGLTYWLRKRSSDRWVQNMAVRHTRADLREQYEAKPKGKGNRAWKRVKKMSENTFDTITWPDYALPR